MFFHRLKGVISLLILMNVTLAHALVPPLSEENRQLFSDDIVTGLVVSVRYEDVTVHSGINRNYTVRMIVNEAEKGSIEPGSTITFTYWKAKQRPEGMTGDFGQYNAVATQNFIRAYLANQTDAAGTMKLSLLSPNGFDKIN